jgi:hypothetical protein
MIEMNFGCPTCRFCVKFQDIPYVLLSGHPLHIGAAQPAVHHGGPLVDEVEFAHQATAGTWGVSKCQSTFSIASLGSLLDYDGLLPVLG